MRPTPGNLGSRGSDSPNKDGVCRRLVVLLAMSGLFIACSADRKPPPSSPADSPNATGQAAYPATPSQPPAPPPPPAPDARRGGDSDTKSVPPAAAPSGSYATPPNRSAAMTQASNDVEASQRELDVAGGDCRNACRALGSMDRAAGRLCGLAQSSDEVQRCRDAKTRVYSARDKVRNTCGQCPDTSVDRNAPIPSR